MEGNGQNWHSTNTMTIDQELNEASSILYGLLAQSPPGDGLPEWGDIEKHFSYSTDAQAGHCAVNQPNTVNELVQVALDPQLGEEEEQRLPPNNSMLDVLTGDTQPGEDGDQLGEEEPAEGDGDDQSGEEELYSGGDGEFSAASEGSATLQVPQEVQRVVVKPGSKAQGVSYHKFNQQWEAHLWVKDHVLRKRDKKGVQIFGGNFETEHEAKQTHDRLAIKFDIRTSHGKPYPLNFAESAQADYMAEHRDWTHRDFLWKLRRHSLKFSRGQSIMKGVTVRELRNKLGLRLRYAAKICQAQGGGKRTANIGTFGTEEEAGKAYDRALLSLSLEKEEVEQWHVITNFRPSIYTEAEIKEAGSKLNFK